jgi:hypothetical protein
MFSRQTERYPSAKRMANEIDGLKAEFVEERDHQLRIVSDGFDFGGNGAVLPAWQLYGVNHVGDA